jgi:hypothetical protein
MEVTACRVSYYISVEIFFQNVGFMATKNRNYPSTKFTQKSCIKTCKFGTFFTVKVSVTLK